MDSLQLYLVMCHPPEVDYINAFFSFRLLYRIKVILHVCVYVLIVAFHIEYVV